jgi:hypothetical protein
MLTAQDIWDQLLLNQAFLAEAPVGPLRDSCHDLLFVMFPTLQPHMSQPATAANFTKMAKEAIRHALDNGHAETFGRTTIATQNLSPQQEQDAIDDYLAQGEEIYVDLTEEERCIACIGNPNADPNDIYEGQGAVDGFEQAISLHLNGQMLLKFQAGIMSVGSLIHHLAEVVS